MTVEELCEKLKRLYGMLDEDDKDEEDLHIEADRLLIEYIGNPEVTRIFNELPKWYS